MQPQNITHSRQADTLLRDHEQVWALHDAMPDHPKVAVLLGAFAGLRVSKAPDCASLTWISLAASCTRRCVGG
jgi:hypothetical protein